MPSVGVDSLHGFGLPCLQWARGNCDDREDDIHRTQDSSKSEVVVSANVAVVATGQRQHRPVSYSTDRADSLSWWAPCVSKAPTASHGGPPCISKGPTAFYVWQLGLPVSPKGQQPPMTVPLLLQVNGMQRRPISYSTDRVDSLSWQASLLLQRADSFPWQPPCVSKRGRQPSMAGLSVSPKGQQPPMAGRLNVSIEPYIPPKREMITAHLRHPQPHQLT